MIGTIILCFSCGHVGALYAGRIVAGLGISVLYHVHHCLNILLFYLQILSYLIASVVQVRGGQNIICQSLCPGPRFFLICSSIDAMILALVLSHIVLLRFVPLFSLLDGIIRALVFIKIVLLRSNAISKLLISLPVEKRVLAEYSIP